ncbi:hypothetical protein Scep_030871 [Stephania cephalantha]|uniref:J domain-containing protein n=1 Tax=Stephania cephalantha TaxID=152367 RepID=A0AAP0E0F9_9MAGN
MARKANHQRNGSDHKSSKMNRVSEPLNESIQKEAEKVETTSFKVVSEVEAPGCTQPSSPPREKGMKTENAVDEKKKNQKSRKESNKKKGAQDRMPGSNQSPSRSYNTRDATGEASVSDASELKEEDKTVFGDDSGSNEPWNSTSCSQNDLPGADANKTSGSFDTMVGSSLGASGYAALKAAHEWIKRAKPLFTAIATFFLDVSKYVQLKTEKAYPIAWRWLVHFGNIVLLVSLLWLDCCIRGLVSFVRLGTTSFFTVIWCSILSVIAMIGILKFLSIMVIGALVAFFGSFILALLIVSIVATVFLWLYGSFWTTGFVILVGGLGFFLRYEYFSLLITTVYSIYCAKTYVGWLGLLLGLNLSFISSDILIYFLKSNTNDHSRSSQPQEQAAGARGQFSSFFGEPMNATPETAFDTSTDRNQGVPSTSGADAEMTPGDEVVRLLNCTDHYSALGLSRYENVDASLLKREYRRKAMLVHPDKNMGNEKAAEAFKKLQNAYEVLLDSFKRKTYDDELRREELLNLFRQNISQRNGRRGPFARPEGNFEEQHGDSRRIACKKCGNFHLWIHTNKSKSKARWCQDCKDFHQAKDGDGWVEQSSRPFLFGLLQKVDTPAAYVCAESKIYDATEWFICQGMRCPANTHKPSFHVNTSVVTNKHGFTKGSGPGQRGAGPSTDNVEEILTEEEFLEFLQKAMQSGIFETAGASSSTDTTSSAKAGNNSKTSGGGNSSKKKRKGKKQW